MRPPCRDDIHTVRRRAIWHRDVNWLCMARNWAPTQPAIDRADASRTRTQETSRLVARNIATCHEKHRLLARETSQLVMTHHTFRLPPPAAGRGGTHAAGRGGTHAAGRGRHPRCCGERSRLDSRCALSARWAGTARRSASTACAAGSSVGGTAATFGEWLGGQRRVCAT
ncbi:hypothetical protein PLICRDRAFT_294761 [Plicaturopsis crispa FD-325 SS-3]|nr:hypothetical protein PLICRDRAFT_294761 [Plicaturopsis crispa FD-325 SS-3]